MCALYLLYMPAIVDAGNQVTELLPLPTDPHHITTYLAVEDEVPVLDGDCHRQVTEQPHQVTVIGSCCQVDHVDWTRPRSICMFSPPGMPRGSVVAPA